MARSKQYPQRWCYWGQCREPWEGLFIIRMLSSPSLSSLHITSNVLHLERNLEMCIGIICTMQFWHMLFFFHPCKALSQTMGSHRRCLREEVAWCNPYLGTCSKRWTKESRTCTLQSARPPLACSTPLCKSEGAPPPAAVFRVCRLPRTATSNHWSTFCHHRILLPLVEFHINGWR